ncbi:uncharacterized protein LOC127751322 [Frankliniella occidentalis]|uniref:Uncharacterized protein LOC127751322 n=1 Tax=Frankliniella occidentalis TaxID=133901 RepID=A0A9C6XTL6_FRAOC|nr:uncharacterized protein LOC127751322 [Frankliniella occidentalis]
MDSEEEEMDPECKTTILKYVSEEVFAEMSKIDKVQFFNRIEHYEHLVTKKGFENLPRPTYTVSCIREKIVSQKKPAKKTGPKARTVVGIILPFFDSKCVVASVARDSVDAKLIFVIGYVSGKLARKFCPQLF